MDEIAMGILILHDLTKMELTKGVRADVVVDELISRINIDPSLSYTLCFMGCGEAVWETQVWYALAHNYKIEDTVFMDRIITSSAIANIQSVYSSMPSPLRPPSIILSFDEITNYMDVQSKHMPDRNYIIIGIHAAMHFETHQDLKACKSYLSMCDELHAQGRLHSQFLNFFAVDSFHAYFPCCKSSSNMCVNALGWAQLSDIIVHQTIFNI
jgi:hypothetical protein